MRRILLIVSFVLSLHIYAQQKPVTRPQGTTSTIKLSTGTDSLQYILGAYIAQWISSNGFTISNRSLFNSAMDNVLLNKTRALPDSLIEPLFTAYQQKNQKNRASMQEQQLFTSIKDKAGIGALPSGVRYMVLKKGSGPRPTEADSIVINLLVKLADGTVVEDTYQAKKPFDAKTSSFFPGIDEPLQMMPEGSRWLLYIPSALAYGDKSTALIPPNSALVIEAELVAVKPVKR